MKNIKNYKKFIKTKYKTWLKLKAKGFDFDFETVNKLKWFRWRDLEVFADNVDPLVVRYLYRFLKTKKQSNVWNSCTNIGEEEGWNALNSVGLYNLLGFDTEKFLRRRRTFCIRHGRILEIYSHKKIKTKNVWANSCIFENGKLVHIFDEFYL